MPTSDTQVSEFLHEWEASVSSTEYRVQPPDTIEISSAQAAEIDGEEESVRQDGKISLRLLGEVEVSGLTTTEISRKIESLMRRYYENPQVNVRVTSRDSKRFYVFGQVSRPGAYHYTGRDSLLYVLSQCQPDRIAWKSQVKVIHPSHDEEKRQVLTVDVDKITEQGRLDQNVLLQENDIVYVPPTPLGWIGLRIQEALWPVSPVMSAVQTPANISSGIDTAMQPESYRNMTYYSD
ncbi:MAG TPA: polysaccharide biosynthesis/export family protein [Phycisphaerae bacterium]|nr:polysaccharide biosynthesis/export family protein [Phycisphaerae bacterium]